MTKEEAIKFMENLEALPFSLQLKAAIKITKTYENKELLLSLPQWIEWQNKNKNKKFIYSQITDRGLREILNNENSTEEEIDAYLIMQKLIS